ncbi:cytochrome P450 [Thelephora ganbajun]|uniref:Cytochrome P450 n=1 Tax=Thelephora ganbajun TaxID=370292 RepID=A0ACB6Z7F1_THEGA|nr:cytochrome P450 [Thelephora ganbajun]
MSLSQLSKKVPPGLALIGSLLFNWKIASLPLTLLGIFRPNFWQAILIFLATLPVSVAILVSLRDRRYAKRQKELGARLPPPIPSKSFAGLDVLKDLRREYHFGYIGELVSNWGEQLGHTMSATIFWEPRIFTTEPEYIKRILATQFEYFEKGPVFRSYMTSLLGTGVFNADGELWKFHRSMSRQFFTKEKISHFDNFDRHADKAISKLRDRLREGVPVDVQDLFCRFTLDSASEFLFGSDVQSLSADLPYPSTAKAAANHRVHPSDSFANAFQKTQVASAARSRVGRFWPLSEFWENKVEKEIQTVFDYVDPIVKRALETKKVKELSKVESEHEDETLLEHMVRLTDDPIILRDETLNIMVAGRDTTAALITFAVYMLSEHPHIYDRLRQEIITTVGNTNRPTPEDLRNMKYLRAVLNETLRLFPSVPFNIRYSAVDVVWPSLTGGKPYFIPAGTRCLYSPYIMQRRKDLWGPTAEEFDPDRFIDDRKALLASNPFMFLPFNAGPRICLGQQFAYNEASFMVVRLVQSFKSFRLAMEDHPESLPPPEWKASGTGRKVVEKVNVKGHLTIYAKVRYSLR